MDKQQLAARITGIFETEFEIAPEKLTPDVNLFQDLGLDSLDMVELMFVLQKEFTIQVRDSEEARAIRTLNDVCDFVLAEIAKNAACSDSPPPAVASSQ